MKVRYSWLQSYFEEKLPEPEKLADLLTMHSQEVEGVEETEGDYVFDVKVLPNRAFDFIDHLGAIRDIAAILKVEPKNLPAAKNYPAAVEVKFSEAKKIIGIDIPKEEVENILSRLGFAIKPGKEGIVVQIPDFRPDVSIKEDVLEEIVRIYGYEKVPEIAPEATILPPKRNDILFFAEAVRNILAGMGFSEVYNYSFARNGVFEVYKPASSDKKFLRTKLSEGLVNVVKENSKNFKEVKIFEVGSTFPAGGETLSLAAAISQSKKEKDGFYAMKGTVDAILTGLGITDFYYEEGEANLADIRIGNSDIGAIDHNFFELNFEELIKIADEDLEYVPVSKYPAIVRDVAVFVPYFEKVENVLGVIESSAGELLVETDLFDIYENDEQKSLAFHLIFQSPGRTLKDEEVNSIMERIFAALDAKSDWEVRR
ncbi:hypothetical protein C4572_01370 [Candidatus Parcubacteria bacterium]|nr:MAG: hypothetical protein C4572_01370 [Candidatus Parcubacteria bacterium]